MLLEIFEFEYICGISLESLDFKINDVYTLENKNIVIDTIKKIDLFLLNNDYYSFLPLDLINLEIALIESLGPSYINNMYPEINKLVNIMNDKKLDLSIKDIYVLNFDLIHALKNIF